MTAEVLERAADDVDPTGAVVAHIGGDDFAVVTTVDAARPVAERAVRAFDDRARELHDADDVDAGGLVGHDRDGHERLHPLLSLSIGGVLWPAGTPATPMDVADAAVTFKRRAKADVGSAVVIGVPGASAAPDPDKDRRARPTPPDG